MADADAPGPIPPFVPRDGEEPLLGIQEVAEAVGVTHRTLRFYEDRGLIEPRRVGTTRVYTRREVARMQLILRGKRLGFSIREIAEFLDLYDADPQHIEQVRRLRLRVRERLEALHEQSAALEKTIDELGSIDAQATRWLTDRDAAAED